jgi:hypothetical protein
MKITEISIVNIKYKISKLKVDYNKFNRNRHN